MKNTKIKNVTIGGKKYPTLNEYKQELGPIVGILFTLSDFENVLSTVINFEKINTLKKTKNKEVDADKEVELINQAIETYYMINMIAKSYLMYIVSLIESKVLTFFNKFIIDEINKEYPNASMMNIPDVFWDKVFRTKGSKGSFKSKYGVRMLNELPSKFFENLTLGHYTFILTRLNDDLIEEFFKAKVNLNNNFVYKHISENNKTIRERKLASFRKALKIVKEFRNQVVHETLIINPYLMESIADKERADKPLVTIENKVQYIFDALSLALADIGYMRIDHRMSRHIDREIKDKNSNDFRKDNGAKLSVSNLKLFNFYKKKQK